MADRRRYRQILQIHTYADTDTQIQIEILPRSRFQLVCVCVAVDPEKYWQRQDNWLIFKFFVVSWDGGAVAVFILFFFCISSVGFYIKFFTFKCVCLRPFASWTFLCFYADENIYVLLIAHKLIYILWRWRFVRSSNGSSRGICKSHCRCLCVWYKSIIWP